MPVPVRGPLRGVQQVGPVRLLRRPGGDLGQEPPGERRRRRPGPAAAGRLLRRRRLRAASAPGRSWAVIRAERAQGAWSAWMTAVSRVTCAVTKGLPSRSAPTQLPKRRNRGHRWPPAPPGVGHGAVQFPGTTAGTTRNRVSSNAAMTVRTSSIGSIALTRSWEVRQSRSMCSRNPRCASARSAAAARGASRVPSSLFRSGAAVPPHRPLLRASVGWAVSTRGPAGTPGAPAKFWVRLLAAHPGDRAAPRATRGTGSRPAAPLPQDPDPLVLLGQVGPVEVDGALRATCSARSRVQEATSPSIASPAGPRSPGSSSRQPRRVDDGVPEPLHVR